MFHYLFLNRNKEYKMDDIQSNVSNNERTGKRNKRKGRRNTKRKSTKVDSQHFNEKSKVKNQSTDIEALLSDLQSIEQGDDKDVLRTSKPYDNIELDNKMSDINASDSECRVSGTNHLDVLFKLDETMENMQGKDKSINFHSSPNTEEVNVDIVTETNITNMEKALVDHKRISEKISNDTIKKSQQSYNVNFVDLSMNEKVNVSLFQNFNQKNKKPIEEQEQAPARDSNILNRKKLFKLYQENASLEGYESSVDVRYVVEDKPKHDAPFLKRLFTKIFGRNQ